MKMERHSHSIRLRSNDPGERIPWSRGSRWQNPRLAAVTVPDHPPATDDSAETRACLSLDSTPYPLLLRNGREAALPHASESARRRLRREAKPVQSRHRSIDQV